MAKLFVDANELPKGGTVLAIGKNPLTRDIDGVKRRTRSGMGSRQEATVSLSLAMPNSKLSARPHGECVPSADFGGTQKNRRTPYGVRLFLVEATGLEPTTSWSLTPILQFFGVFSTLSRAFLSRLTAFVRSSKHCFQVVQTSKWSKVWPLSAHTFFDTQKLLRSKQNISHKILYIQ